MLAIKRKVPYDQLVVYIPSQVTLSKEVKKTQLQLTREPTDWSGPCRHVAGHPGNKDLPVSPSCLQPAVLSSAEWVDLANQRLFSSLVYTPFPTP